MPRHTLTRSLFVLMILIFVPVWGRSVQNQQEARREALRKNAWGILWAGTQSRDSRKRSKAVEALGFLRASPEVVHLAENKLQDPKPEVRAAAANALGEMHSSASIPQLEKALSDNDLSVGLAAARALLRMKQNAGYSVYYAVLTGQRKSGQGLIAQQLDQLDNPRKFAEFAFDQGIGFLPYAGYCLEVMDALKKKDNSPLRAAAAGVLANDPDPRSGKALAAACSDKNWMVRLAALSAIALRGDPSLLPAATHALQDNVDVVRYTAAAVVLRLSQSA